jgi:hypothetical protein
MVREFLIVSVAEGGYVDEVRTAELDQLVREAVASGGLVEITDLSTGDSVWRSQDLALP